LSSWAKVGADPGLLQRAAAPANVIVQCAAALVAHHEIDRLVGAKEIEHAHDIGMRQAGERTAFLEEGFHADAEGRQVLLRDARIRLAVRAQGERRGQVLLDRDRRLILIMSEYTTRSRRRRAANDAVVLELRAYRNRLVDLPAWLVGLGCHLLL